MSSSIAVCDRVVSQTKDQIKKQTGYVCCSCGRDRVPHREIVAYGRCEDCWADTQPTPEDYMYRMRYGVRRGALADLFSDLGIDLVDRIDRQSMILESFEIEDD